MTLDVKSAVVWSTSTFHEKICCKYFYILHQLHFHENKVKSNAFQKNSYILDPIILLWKTPYHMLFSAFLRKYRYCTLGINFHVSS